MADVELQIAVPLAVGIPDQVARGLLNALAAMGLGAIAGPQGPGNLLVFVAQPVAGNIPDSVLGELQTAVGAVVGQGHVLGPPHPVIQSSPAPAAQPATGDNTSTIGIMAAEQQASATYGVPVDVLEFVRRNESGDAVGSFQEHVTNPEGYGGFYGLPADMLGTVQDQADNAAQILARQYARFGNWRDAISAYNVGPNGDFSQSYGQRYQG